MSAIDMGDLATIVEPGRLANWLEMSFNCWLDEHNGCWFPQYDCQCECHVRCTPKEDDDE